jgi:hypothetical protein
VSDTRWKYSPCTCGAGEITYTASHRQYCDYKLGLTHLACEVSPETTISEVEWFTRKGDKLGIGKRRATVLAAHGLRTLSDLTGLVAADLAGLPRVGVTTANRLIRAAVAAGVEADPTVLTQSEYVNDLHTKVPIGPMNADPPLEVDPIDALIEKWRARAGDLDEYAPPAAAAFREAAAELWAARTGTP